MSCRIFKMLELPRYIYVFSLKYDPSCLFKTSNDFLCESPQREESFLNEKHPYNSAEPPAQYEPHNTSVSSP